jgi:hypothetical protein
VGAATSRPLAGHSGVSRGNGQSRLRSSDLAILVAAVHPGGQSKPGTKRYLTQLVIPNCHAGERVMSAGGLGWTDQATQALVSLVLERRCLSVKTGSHGASYEPMFRCRGSLGAREPLWFRAPLA